MAFCLYFLFLYFFIISFFPFFFFFFNDTATTEIYTLSLHDALPISRPVRPPQPEAELTHEREPLRVTELRPIAQLVLDRKSTRLNSSHVKISYAVFCLKKKKKRTDGTAHNYDNRHGCDTRQF